MTLKKVELHVHLEGSISPHMAHILAKRNQLSIPDELISKDGTHYPSRDFMHFLGVYDQVAALIKTPQDYYDITLDYLKSSALDGGIYVEMMYSPDHAEQATGVDSIDHLQAIQTAIDDAQSNFGITGRIIITAVRHFGVDSAIRVAQSALKKSVPSAVGFGLGGDEINYPPKLFKKSYAIAAEGGLHCTVHAGEFGPAESMREAIEHLPIKRIGHGVQVIHCKDTIEIIKDKDIALELCPSSNLLFGLFKDIHDHPFDRLFKSGIKISINSDDPPFMSTSLAKEYELVQKSYRYSDETINQINRMAIDAAFADENTKTRLHNLL